MVSAACSRRCSKSEAARSGSSPIAPKRRNGLSQHLPDLGWVRRSVLGVLAGAVLSGIVHTAPAQRTSSVAFQPCRLPRLDEEVRCTTYQVFEDREAKGRTIGLRVAVLPATGTTPAPGALFILVGGPGVGATVFAEF